MVASTGYKKKTAVFVSGTGSNLKNLIKYSQKKEFPITSCCMQTDDEVKLWMLNTKKIKY